MVPNRRISFISFHFHHSPPVDPSPVIGQKHHRPDCVILGASYPMEGGRSSLVELSKLSPKRQAQTQLPKENNSKNGEKNKEERNANSKKNTKEFFLLLYKEFPPKPTSLSLLSPLRRPDQHRMRRRRGCEASDWWSRWELGGSVPSETRTAGERNGFGSLCCYCCLFKWCCLRFFFVCFVFLQLCLRWN